MLHKSTFALASLALTLLLLSVGCGRIADYYADRGNSKSRRGDYEGAIADCTKAIRLNPDLAVAYYIASNTNATAMRIPVSWSFRQVR